MQTDMILITEKQADLFKSFGVDVELRYAVPRKVVDAFASLAEPPTPEPPVKKKKNKVKGPRISFVSIAPNAAFLAKSLSGKTGLLCQQLINCAAGAGKFPFCDSIENPWKRMRLVDLMVEHYGYPKSDANWLVASAIRAGVLRGIA